MVSLESLFGGEGTVMRETEFQLLLLSTAFPILGTALVSPVLDSVIEPFGTTAADVGLMVSFMTAPGVVIIPIAGVLADRYGRKPVLTASLVTFGCGGAAIAFTTDFRLVLALRFVQGVGFAGLVPTITTSIGDMYDGQKEATAQGLRLTTNGLSGTVFPLLAGLLVVVAWQYPFLLYALALPVAAAVHRWFEEPTEAGSPDPGSDSSATPEGGDARSYRRALFRLVRRPRVLAMVVARALPVVVWIGFFTYNSIVVVRLLDGSPPQAGFLVAVGNFVFGVAASQSGRIASTSGGRLLPLVAANVALGGGFALVLFAPDLAVATAGIAVSGVGVGVTLSLYRSIITGLAPESLRGGLVSISAAGSRVAATVTPVAMGAVVAAVQPTVGFAAAVRLAGLGAAVVGGGGGVVCLLVAHAAPRVPDERPSPAEE